MPAVRRAPWSDVAEGAVTSSAGSRWLRRALLVLVLVAAWASGPPAVASDGVHWRRLSKQLPGFPAFALATDDIDDDGHPDLVAGGYLDPQLEQLGLRTFRGAGRRGRFLARPSSTVAMDHSPHEISTGDFDE